MIMASSPNLLPALDRGLHQHRSHLIRNPWIIELMLSDEGHLDTRVEERKNVLLVPLAQAGKLGWLISARITAVIQVDLDA